MPTSSKCSAPNERRQSIQTCPKRSNCGKSGASFRAARKHWEWLPSRSYVKSPSSASLSIIIVCRGNICRSPFAAELLKARLAGHEYVSVGSRGTRAYHVGKPADGDAIVQAATYGVD